ncbi:MAG: hypothetical protein NVS2B14_17490 [Chamaesiphon sp.]
MIVGWAWRGTKLYNLPYPLPGWLRIWFLTMQIGGAVLPLTVMLLWGVWWGFTSVLVVLVSYLLMLGLQILTESLTLRRFHSTVFVMVPYLYIPYRIWQLYEGWVLLSPEPELIWVRYLLLFEIILWSLNYCLALAQLPRLFYWQGTESKS